MKHSTSNRSPFRSATKIVMIYAAISVTYILFSDQLVAHYLSDINTMTRVAVFKGWGFVLATSLLIFYLLRREIIKYSEAEKALVESKRHAEFLAELLEKSSQPFMVGFPDGRLGEFNSAFAELIGYSKEELARLNWAKDLMSSEWCKQNRTVFDRLHHTGKPQRFETTYRRKDGSEVPIEILVHLSRAEQGQARHYYSFLQDITDRKRTLRQLEEETDRRRILFEESPDGILIIDPETARILEFNAAAHDQLGYSREEFGKLTIFDLEAKETIEETKSRIARTVLQGNADFETKQRTKTGEIRDVYVRAKTLQIQGQSVYHCIWRDITNQKQAEQEIRNRAEISRKLIEASTDAILVRTKDIITYANPATVKLFGAQSEKDLIGKVYLDLVHPDDREESARRVKMDIEEKKVAPLREHKMVAFDGRTIYVESTGIPVAIMGEWQTFGIFRDISERKRAAEERERLESHQRQVQKMEAIGTLAGGIAHDFNNILSVIIGNSNLLELSGNLAEEDRIPLQQILAAGERAKQLVRQILTFSRRSEQRQIVFNLKPLMKETYDFLKSTIPTGIELRQKLRIGSQDTILGDPTQLQQVLMNLCTNAAHAMENQETGLVEISLERAQVTRDDALVQSDIEPGEFVRLTVSDSGEGISPAILDRIFEPYFTTKEKGKGTGLGLSVVHGIVKDHGGFIKVYSEVGRGTRFDVFFPITASDYQKDAGVTDSKLPGGSETILLVDDEKALVDMGKIMLERLGYKVDTRTSPLEAIESFRAHPERYDAVVTDMSMPQMSGISLSKKLLEIRQNIPILLCTGFSDRINEEGAHSAGIKAFAFKPLSLVQLANTLRAILNEARKSS